MVICPRCLVLAAWSLIARAVSYTVLLALGNLQNCCHSAAIFVHESDTNLQPVLAVGQFCCNCAAAADFSQKIGGKNKFYPVFFRR